MDVSHVCSGSFRPGRGRKGQTPLSSWPPMIFCKVNTNIDFLRFQICGFH